MQKRNENTQLPFSFSQQTGPRLKRGAAGRQIKSELISHPMKSKKSPAKKKPEFVVRSLTLTTTLDKELEQIGLDASDALGWKVSRSAMMRALLVYIHQQGPEWIQETIHPLVEKELGEGVVWGHRGK
jgi:hypothetical protein